MNESQAADYIDNTSYESNKALALVKEVLNDEEDNKNDERLDPGEIAGRAHVALCQSNRSEKS